MLRPVLDLSTRCRSHDVMVGLAVQVAPLIFVAELRRRRRVVGVGLCVAALNNSSL